MSASFAARAKSLHAMEAAGPICRAAQMGSWGDGCCQHADQAVGLRSHCYSPRRHVQGMSDTFIGGTAESWSMCLLCIIGHREQRIFTPDLALCRAPKLRGVNKARSCARRLLMEQRWIA